MGDDTSMILMLDHITIAAPAEKRAETLAGLCGYGVRFWEDGLPNIAAKQPLFQKPHASHQLIKLDSPDGYPLEVVLYDTCRGLSDLVINQSKAEIDIPTQDIAGSAVFWRMFGLCPDKDDPALLTGKGPLDRMPVKIRLLAGRKNKKAWLDQQGPVALAFIVTRQEDLLKKLSRQGFSVSEIDSLCVNGQTLCIAFAASRYGDLAEIISIEKPTQKSDPKDSGSAAVTVDNPKGEENGLDRLDPHD